MQDSWKSLLGTSLAHFANDGGSYIFITLLPELPIPGSFLIGLLGALQSIFSVATSPLVGREADSGRAYGKYLSLGLVIMGLGIVGYSVSVIFASGFSLFLFLVPFAVMSGVGGSFYHPLAGAVLHDKWRGSKLGRYMGINGAIGSLGRAVYPLFVVGLVVYLTVPSVITLAFVSFLTAIAVLYTFKGMRFGSDSPLPNDGLTSRPRPRTPFGLILPRVLALTLVAFTRGLFSVGLVYWLPIYLINVRHLAYGFEFAVTFSLVLGMAVVGQPVFGYIGDRLGRRLALGISILISSIAMVAFLLTADPFQAAVYLSVFGFSGLTGFPLLLPLATSIIPEGAETMSGSIVWGVGNVGGGAAGPFLIGLLAESSLLGSLTGGFFVVVAIGLVALAILPFVPRAK